MSGERVDSMPTASPPSEFKLERAQESVIFEVLRQLVTKQALDDLLQHRGVPVGSR